MAKLQINWLLDVKSKRIYRISFDTEKHLAISLYIFDKSVCNVHGKYTCCTYTVCVMYDTRLNCFDGSMNIIAGGDQLSLSLWGVALLSRLLICYSQFVHRCYWQAYNACNHYDSRIYMDTGDNMCNPSIDWIECKGMYVWCVRASVRAYVYDMTNIFVHVA